MDIFTDKGFLELVRIKVAHPDLVPKYVSNADLTALSQSKDSLVSAQFADSIGRQYPVHNKVATWLSAAYFSKNHANLTTKMAALSEYTWSTIKAAAEIWGIEDDVNNIFKAYSESATEKVAEIWGWELCNDKKYPLHTPKLVKEAVSYFETNRDKYPKPMRTIIASNIYKQARAFNVLPGDVVRKEAGAGYPDRRAVVAALEDRVKRLELRDKAAADICSKMAETISEVPTDELFDATAKCLDVVEQLDRQVGFHYTYKYASTDCIERPVDAFYKITTEEAKEAVTRRVKLAGIEFDTAKIAEYVKSDEFNKPFNDTFFNDKLNKLYKAGSLSAEDPTYKVISAVINDMTDEEKWLLGKHLSTL